MTVGQRLSYTEKRKAPTGAVRGAAEKYLQQTESNELDEASDKNRRAPGIGYGRSSD
jgi:hypothetical protein